MCPRITTSKWNRKRIHGGQLKKLRTDKSGRWVAKNATPKPLSRKIQIAKKHHEQRSRNSIRNQSAVETKLGREIIHQNIRKNTAEKPDTFRVVYIKSDETAINVWLLKAYCIEITKEAHHSVNVIWFPSRSLKILKQQNVIKSENSEKSTIISSSSARRTRHLIVGIQDSCQVLEQAKSETSSETSYVKSSETSSEIKSESSSESTATNPCWSQL